jgi:hypothetical protein
MSRANYMELVVDALVGRLEVAGFQSDIEGDADEAAWALWQDNNLDGGSSLAFLGGGDPRQRLHAGVSGSAARFRITPEHPTQVITEGKPGEPARWPQR